MMLIPRFTMFRTIGLYNTHWALILPGMFTAFGTFTAGQKCQPIGHIGYYYPAEVWISEYGKLYAKYEYQDEIECFPDVFALIERELRQCKFDSAAMKTVEVLDGKL